MKNIYIMVHFVRYFTFESFTAIFETKIQRVWGRIRKFDLTAVKLEEKDVI